MSKKRDEQNSFWYKNKEAVFCNTVSRFFSCETD